MQVYQTSDLNARMERVYAFHALNDPAQDENFVRTSAGIVWFAFHNDTTDVYQKAQRHFDQVDYPKINTAIGRYPDYNLFDS